MNSEHILSTSIDEIISFEEIPASQIELENISSESVSIIDERDSLNSEHVLPTSTPKSDINTSLIKTISTEILSKLGIPDGVSLVQAVADAVVNKLNAPKADTFCKEEIQDIWTDSGDKILCEPCINIVNSMKNSIPSNLHSYIRGEYGAIKKVNVYREVKKYILSHLYMTGVKGNFQKCVLTNTKI